MTTPVVELADVTKRFGEVVAVDGVTLELIQGETVSILGPSGCGKTTLLRLIAGFERVDAGEVRIEGRPVSLVNSHVQPENRNVGMVFQDYALFPHLTVGQNVSFGLGKLSREEGRRRLSEVLELVRLGDLEDRYPHELSGGQQQRVALARTLAPKPVTLLLDEPFSNLDANMRVEMRQEVDAILRESGSTTVFVTHDREEAFAMADRVGVMQHGRMEQTDTPDALYHEPATPFVAQASGICDFLPGTMSNGRAVTELGALLIASTNGDLGTDWAVDVLVRLDDFQLTPDPEGKSVVVSREFRGDEILLVVRMPSGATLRCRRHHYSTLPVGTNVTLFPIKSAPFMAFTGGELERPADE